MVEIKIKGVVNLESTLLITEEQEAKINANLKRFKNLLADFHMTHTVEHDKDGELDVIKLKVGRSFANGEINGDAEKLSKAIKSLKVDHVNVLKFIDSLPIEPGEDAANEEALQHERDIASLQKKVEALRDEATKKKIHFGAFVVDDAAENVLYAGNTPSERFAHMVLLSNIIGHD